MPSAWVWLVFSLSMLIFTASMLTLREGRRFLSRPLSASEQRVVLAALKLDEEQEGRAHPLLVAMLREHRIRAMDRMTFARPEERSAFGYTDERGRILLNPNLCFTCQQMLAPRLLTGVAESDLVATLATLQHEVRHLVSGASETMAYEEEWRYVCRTRSWCVQNEMPGLSLELLDWERHLPARVRLHVGQAAAGPMQLRIGGRNDFRESPGACE